MKPWKVQKLAGDVVYDLRSRGLLPVAALLVIGMVVVPVMISRSSKESSTPAAATGPTVSAPENESAVLAYSPGVRNYQKRLDELQTKDPFKQQFQSSGAAAAALGGSFTTTIGGSSSSGGSTTIGTGGGSTGGGSGGSGGGGDTGGDGKTKTRTVVQTKYLSYRMDVAFGEVGSQVRINDVEPLSFLPSEDTPVLVFLGVGGGGSKSLFLVSSDVSAVTGNGACVASSNSSCEMLVMQSGQIEDFVYTPNGKTYRLKVLAIGKHFTK